jgi:hypothetical protein
VVVLFAAALPPGAPWWVTPAAALAVTVTAAALSYRFVEAPIRRRGFGGAFSAIVAGLRSGRRRVLTWAATVLAALVLIAGVGLTGAAIALDPVTGQAEAEILEGGALLAAPGYAVAPRRPQPLPTGDQIYAIGDSVMLSAVPELQQAFPGIAIDATVSRQLSDVEPIVATLVAAGGMRPILVIGLGTNGWIDAATLPRVLDQLDPGVRVIVVNVQAPREWTPEVNAILYEFARSKRDVELSNWHDAIQPHLDVLARDDIHMGPAGARIYAAALADALQRLAELPPLVHDNERGDAARPV